MRQQVIAGKAGKRVKLGLPIWITGYDSFNPDENIRADNLETSCRFAFSKQSVEGVLMWGFWAGSR
jgi:hypothetical protein